MHLVNKVSITFFLLAVTVFSYGYFSYERYEWIAVTKPIDISQQNLSLIHISEPTRRNQSSRMPSSA